MSNPQFAGTTLGNFRPTDIAGLSFWIDAQDASTVTSNANSIVTGVTDKGPNARSLVNAMTTGGFRYNQPATLFNGSYPSFYYNGAGQSFTLGSNGLFSISQPATVFTVQQLVGNAAFQDVFDSTNSGNRMFGFYDVQISASPNYRIFAGSTIAPPGTAPRTPVVYSHYFNGANSQIFQNGSRILIGNAGTQGSTGITIGSRFTQNQETFQGHICEVIYYNSALSNADRERVEGYLAWKWGLQEILPLGHPYEFLPLISTAPANGFDPRSIAGMSLWLDAQDTTTTTGNPVTTWVDKSGAGFNATSALGPSQGTYNGYPVLSFNGTNQRMLSSHTVNPASHTLILVYRPATLTGNFAGNTSVFRYQPSGPYIVFPYMSGTVQRGYITSYDGPPLDAGNSTLVANAVTTSLNLVFISILSGSQQVLLNGTLQSANTQALTAGTSGTLAIGYFPPGNNEFFQGDIGEMMVYSRALTLDERINITGYLAWKWGLQSTLPINAYAPWSTTNINNYIFLPTIPYSLNIPLMDLAPVFNPLSFSGSVVWVDSADTSTFTFSSGSTISQITNKAPGASPLFASGSPSLVANSLNGRQSILMGSGNYLAGGSTVSGTTISCFAVAFTTAAQPRVGSDQRLISLVTSTSLDFNTPSAVIGMFNQQGTSVIGTYRNGVFVSATPLSQNVPFIGASIYNGVNGQMFKDGSPGNITPSTGTFGIVKFSLGLQLNSPGNTEFWIGNIGEVLVYNRNLSVSERQTIEGYLAWKWGMVANLPARHPFKDYPPPP
jgi:hypothetical protein